MKISDMTNEQLDYWVAKAQGWDFVRKQRTEYGFVYQVWWNSPNSFIKAKDYHPSTNWQQAGELVEKFNVMIAPSWVTEKNGWHGACSYEQEPVSADTPTKAICIAVIASVFGEEIND